MNLCCVVCGLCDGTVFHNKLINNVSVVEHGEHICLVMFCCPFLFFFPAIACSFIASICYMDHLLIAYSSLNLGPP